MLGPLFGIFTSKVASNKKGVATCERILPHAPRQMHLKLMGSDVVHKWPRCSLQRKRTYGDVRIDKSLLSSLAGVWVIILAVGLTPVLFCLVKHLYAPRVFHALFHFSRPTIHHL